MRPVLLLTGVALLLSGCAGPSDDGPSESPSPTLPPPREILAKQGNNNACSEVLRDSVTFPFRVEEGYTHIQVSWHAAGHGFVGYEIKGTQATVVSRPDYNPGNTPCDHSTHTGASAETFAAGPGDYEAVVRNTGILGWTLSINEVVQDAADPHASHPPG